MRPNNLPPHHVNTKDLKECDIYALALMFIFIITEKHFITSPKADIPCIHTYLEFKKTCRLCSLYNNMKIHNSHFHLMQEDKIAERYLDQMNPDIVLELSGTIHKCLTVDQKTTTPIHELENIFTQCDLLIKNV